MAPSTVVMLSRPGRPSLVLKIGPGPEERRLRWLTGKLPVAEVMAIASQDGTDYLLMTKLPGLDGSDDRVIRGGMRFVELLARAANDAWRPGGGTVLTHGDASLPNFHFDRGEVSGFVDLGLAGTSDPYRDLALAARSLMRNMGGKWVRPFLQAHGAPMEARRLQFFMLLDESVMARPA